MHPKRMSREFSRPVVIFVVALLALLTGVAFAQDSMENNRSVQEPGPTAKTSGKAGEEAAKPAGWSKVLQSDPTQAYCQKDPSAPGCAALLNNKPSVLSPGPPQQQQARIVEVPLPKPRVLARPAKELAIPASWRFAHPNADVLVGINAAALRDSATLHWLAQRLSGPLQVKPEELEARLAQTRGIDQCWVSLHSGDVLLLLQGRLDYPEGFVRMPDGMSSYRISRSAVLLGSERSVAAAFQRLAHASLGKSAAETQMIQAAGDHDLWFSGTRGVFLPIQLASLYRGLSSYSGGIRLQDGIRIGATLKYATEDAARRSVGWLQESSSLKGVARVSGQIEANTVQLLLAVPQARMAESVDRALAQPWGKQLTTLAAEALATSDRTVVYGEASGPKQVEGLLPAPPRNPGKLMVYGLPGGPKEL